MASFLICAGRIKKALEIRFGQLCDGYTERSIVLHAVFIRRDAVSIEHTLRPHVHFAARGNSVKMCAFR